jgi:hypothetical protein
LYDNTHRPFGVTDIDIGNPSLLDYATKKDDKMLDRPKTTTRAILKIVKSAIGKEVNFVPKSESICCQS